MKFVWADKIDNGKYSELYAFYQKEWWTAGRTFEDVELMLKGSDEFVVCYTITGEMAGFARILTDYVFKAFIFDVIIKSEFRGCGLGAEIVKRVIDHQALSKVKSFELYCPDRLAPFYENLGFVKSSSSLFLYKS